MDQPHVPFSDCPPGNTDRYILPFPRNDYQSFFGGSTLITFRWGLRTRHSCGLNIQVIFVNIVLMIIETNSDAACFPDYSSNIEGCSHRSRNKVWLQVCIILLQIIYTVECALRAYVELGDYLWNWWNQIDLWTAVLGWIAVALNSVNLNILRSKHPRREPFVIHGSRS